METWIDIDEYSDRQLQYRIFDTLKKALAIRGSKTPREDKDTSAAIRSHKHSRKFYEHKMTLSQATQHDYDYPVKHRTESNMPGMHTEKQHHDSTRIC